MCNDGYGGMPRSLLLLLLLLAAAGGPGPEAAVRRFLDVASTAHRDRLFDELGPATQYRLKQDAERAALMAGQRTLPPSQLLSVDVPPGAYQVHTIRQSGSEAEVEVTIAAYRQRFRCVRVNGRWKIEL